VRPASAGQQQLARVGDGAIGLCPNPCYWSIVRGSPLSAGTVAFPPVSGATAGV